MNERPNSRRATFLVVGVFLIGVGLGALGSYAVMKRTFAAPRERLHGSQKRARWVEHLTNELSLTAEQQKDIDKILAQLQERYKAIHEQQAPEIENARRSSRDQMRAILTPDQKPKFEEFLRRLDDERAKSHR